MAGNSKLAIASAIGGNTLVTIAKAIAFVITGSGSMLSEAIHSLADVMNQTLLYLGVVKAERKADDEYQYGYGRDRFVWSLMSAVGIFFLGCGVTIYHGISSLLDPHPLQELGWAYGVLALEFVVEGIVLYIAFKALYVQKGDLPFMTFVRTEADPAAVAVLLEDAVACVGVVIAFVCISLSQWTDEPRWDAVGSILVGLLLGAVAIWLIARNRELLLGRAIPDKFRDKILAIVEAQSTVECVVNFKSEMIDTETFDILIGIRFDGDELSAKNEGRLREVWEEGLNDYDSFRAFAHDYADQLMHGLSAEIDAMEAAIKEAVPQVKHIDIEPEVGSNTNAASSVAGETPNEIDS